MLIAARLKMYEPILKTDRPATKRIEAQIERSRKRMLESKKKADENPTEKNIVAFEKTCITLTRRERKLENPFHYCGDYEPIDAEQTIWHLRQIHQDENPYLQTMLIDNNPFTYTTRRHGCDMKWLINNGPNLLALGYNTYCATADFFIRNDGKMADSSDASVQKIGAVIVDLDYDNTEYEGLLVEDLIATMRAEGAFKSIGEPSYCMQTSIGAGAYLIYLLEEPVLILRQEKNIKRWADNTGLFVRYFSKYGADPKCVNVSRVFRLPGSYHQASESWSRILDFESIKDTEPKRYNYQELITALKGVVPEPEEDMKEDIEEEPFISLVEDSVSPSVEEAAPAYPGKEKAPGAIQKPQEQRIKKKEEIKVEILQSIIPKSGIATLAYNRCLDLSKIVSLRDYDMEGHRNELLFIAATQLVLCVSEEKYQLEWLETLNNCFKEPLSDKDVNNLLNSAKKKEYKFSDRTIISRLSITNEELSHLQVLGKGRNDNKDSDRKYRKSKIRYDNRQTKTKAKKNYQTKRIKELKEKGYTLKQIAEELNIGVSTVQRALKEAS